MPELTLDWNKYKTACDRSSCGRDPCFLRMTITLFPSIKTVKWLCSAGCRAITIRAEPVQAVW